MNDQSIIIVGFMGSGKTTVAEKLAHELQCDWVDLDELITLHEGSKPSAIIQAQGEDKFRLIESRMLQKALQEQHGRVIAAGGGAWTIPQNRKLIAEHRALAIWLDAPFELCWRRIEETDELRPLASSREMARNLFDERRPTYKLADFHIIIDETQKAGEIAREIVRALSRDGENP